ncbi:MAG: hypothetical protein OXE93_05395 [bacterium]|nr:hypothetical protein [bacterium]
MNNNQQNPNIEGVESSADAQNAHAPGIDPNMSTLGEALGTAVGRQANRPVYLPPVAQIAERAQARARARNVRRTVAGVAASFALLAGGFAVWNASSSDSPTEVIVASSSVTDGEPNQAAAMSEQAQAEPQAAESVAPVSEAAADLADALVTAAAATPSTAEVSTGPVLSWTEIQPAATFGHDAQEANAYQIVGAVGNGEVLVRADTINGTEYLVSSNGSDWTEVYMPGDIHFDRAWDLAGDRWLVAGFTSSILPDASINQAAYSDDRGASWTPLALGSGTSQERVSIADAMVSGENMVVAVNVRSNTDIADLIVARGLAPDKESIQGPVSLQGNTVSFSLTLADEMNVEELSSSVDYESFVLTPAEQDLVDSGHKNLVRLYWSNGESFQQVAEYPANTVEGYGTSTGFELLMLGDQESQKLLSADGRQWRTEPLVSSNTVQSWEIGTQYGLGNGGTVWTSGSDAGDYRVERFSGAFAAPLAAEVPEGVANVLYSSVGPGGIALLALPYDFNSLMQSTPQPPLRVSKDGYELRYTQQDDTLALWDLAANQAVLEFDPQATSADVLPQGVSQDEQSGSLTFEDPATGNVLVTFGPQDLEAMFVPLVETLQSLDQDTITQTLNPQQWIGWSLDGTTWGWQTAAEAFGNSTAQGNPLADSDLSVDVAVGADFVIAMVDTYPNTAELADNSFPETIGWYIAPIS